MITSNQPITGGNSSTTVAVAVTNVASILLSANQNRKGITITNPSGGAGNVLLCFDTIPTSTLFRYSVSPGVSFDIPKPIPKGTLRAILSVAGPRTINVSEDI